ncbi:hypothetical protein BY996DRAFT_6745744 [Phakopsora pachyrhizi]|nr:hypothetical protein BY996DRAFT_6745744 [Phakopsora pachyrhizi]
MTFNLTDSQSISLSSSSSSKTPSILDQARACLFQELKSLTVPILGLIPIKKTSLECSKLHSHLSSLRRIIQREAGGNLLRNSSMILYILFPLEQLLHSSNLLQLPESELNLLLELVIILTDTINELPEENLIWRSKEVPILEAVSLLLVEESELNNQEGFKSASGRKSRTSGVILSEESIVLALELVTRFIWTRQDNLITQQEMLDHKSLSHQLNSTPPLSSQLLEFLFRNLINILDSLNLRVSTTTASSHISLDRVFKTVELTRLSLLRISSTKSPQGSSLQLLSTILPQATSKLTQLACSLSKRRRFSKVLGLVIQTIEWLLTSCLDEQLPDIKQMLLKINHQQDFSPQVTSHSQILAQISSLSMSQESNSSRHQQDSKDLKQIISVKEDSKVASGSRVRGTLVCRDEDWLVFTSEKVSVVMKLLSDSLTHSSHTKVQEAWINLCVQLLKSCGNVLRKSSYPTTVEVNPGVVVKSQDGLVTILDTLLTLLTNQNSFLSYQKFFETVNSIKGIFKTDLFSIILDFVKKDLQLLLDLLLQLNSENGDQIIQLTKRLSSSIQLALNLYTCQKSLQKDLYQIYLEKLDFSKISRSVRFLLNHLELIIPKVYDFSSKKFKPYQSISTINQSFDHQTSTNHSLPSSFPKLAFKNFFDDQCVSSLESLISKVFEVVLSFSSSRFSTLIFRPSLEVNYLDELLNLSIHEPVNFISERPLGVFQRLNSLWVLTESVRVTRSVLDGTKKDGQRQQFQRVEKFCFEALRRLLEDEELDRINGVSFKGKSDMEGNFKTLDQTVGGTQLTYVKGYDRLTFFDSLKPLSVSKAQDSIIKQQVYQTLRSCLILRFISTLAYISEEKFHKNLSWVLFYVLSHFSSPLEYLQLHARATLEVISFHCGYASTSNMLSGNIDYISFSISSQMIPNQFNIRAPFVLENLIRSVGLFNMLPLVEQVILEDCFELLDFYHGYDVICEQLIQLFKTVMDLMKEDIEMDEQMKREKHSSKATIGSSSSSSSSSDRPEETGSSNCFGLDELIEAEIEFRNSLQSFFSNPTTVEKELEKFERHLSAILRLNNLKANRVNLKTNESSQTVTQECLQTKKDEGEDDEVIKQDEDLKDNLGLTVYQNLASELIGKSCNFLTHSSPRVRLQVCQLISSGVSILGSTAERPQESSLLPFVHRFWPTIMNRLNEIESSRETLEIFKNLCKHVGSFMGKKLMDDIWPKIRYMIDIDGEDDEVDRGIKILKIDEDDKKLKRSKGLRKDALKCLKEIIKSSNGIKWKESIIWEIVTVLMNLKDRFKINRVRRRRIKVLDDNYKSKLEILEVLNLVDEIFELLIEIGFEGTVFSGKQFL